MGSPRSPILIVDDEESVRDLLVQICGNRYACKTACGAAEAIDRLTDEPFDAVLTDVSMPGMSGLALCGLVREMWPETAVIIVSGFSSRDEAHAWGAADYIEKPFMMEDVLDSLERVISR